MRKTLNDRLLPVVLILFVLQVLLLPALLGVTYASRSHKPEHILTYEKRRLTWDKTTEVGADGAALLDLFDPEYRNIRADDGENVVAPGEDAACVIRLQNTAKYAVGYTAVLYVLADADLPVTAALSGEGFSDAARYALPESAQNAQIVRAVSGELGAGRMQEFDIDWDWAFENDADAEDTALGDDAADGNAASLTLGFYLTVADDDVTVEPVPPDTGDDTNLCLYLILMLSSGAALTVLLVERFRNHGKKDA